MKNITEVSVGSRVVGFSGMHGQGSAYRAGTVVEHVTDRWGTHLKVQMDDGSVNKVPSLNGTAVSRHNGESFRILTGFGIGWYELTGGE